MEIINNITFHHSMRLRCALYSALISCRWRVFLLLPAFASSCSSLGHRRRNRSICWLLFHTFGRQGFVTDCRWGMCSFSLRFLVFGVCGRTDNLRKLWCPRGRSAAIETFVMMMVVNGLREPTYQSYDTIWWQIQLADAHWTRSLGYRNCTFAGHTFIVTPSISFSGSSPGDPPNPKYNFGWTSAQRDLLNW